jgi:hypothetical protein
MGKILNRENMAKGKVKCTVLMEREEALQLRGNFKGIHLFSPAVLGINVKIMETGVGHSTKYFTVPEKEISIYTQTKESAVICQRAEDEKHHYFIYVVPKKHAEIDA